MENLKKLFIVLDPSQDSHVALDRAVITSSKLKSVSPEVYLFIGVDSESTDTRVNNDNIFRDDAWFAGIKKPLRESDTKYSVEISWCSEWQPSILRASSRFEADLIMLPVYPRASSSRLTFSDSKWALLRNSECPVLVVRPGANPRREVVLSAISLLDESEENTKLNAKIIEQGRWMASLYGADFHVVSAYPDSMNYPDRAKLLRDFDVEPSKVHVKTGTPASVINEVAGEVDADVVVIGTQRRQGLSAALRGNTAEKVIEALDHDVLVINC